ncbi:hypothetical protein LEP1GSC072_3013 [Leptospira noguchii str. Bonito]|nr:hypothetical protein LEP1GSC072_3013 [Leptospira noguchii str. Bonito]
MLVPTVSESTAKSGLVRVPTVSESTAKSQLVLVPTVSESTAKSGFYKANLLRQTYVKIVKSRKSYNET